MSTDSRSTTELMTAARSGLAQWSWGDFSGSRGTRALLEIVRRQNDRIDDLEARLNDPALPDRHGVRPPAETCQRGVDA